MTIKTRIAYLEAMKPTEGAERDRQRHEAKISCVVWAVYGTGEPPTEQDRELATQEFETEEMREMDRVLEKIYGEKA